MEFLRSGELRYHISVGDREQVIPLRYRLEGSTLHTENPAAPHSTAVNASRGAGDTLVLDFGGAQALLIRELAEDAEPRSYIQ